MVRYPHSIAVSWKGAPVKDEPTGAYTAGVPVTKTVACSVTNNTAGKKITTGDGTMVEYVCSLMMERQTWAAPYGANATLTLDDGTVLTYQVKRMHNYQTYSKIWL